MKELELLHAKIELLLQKYSSLQEENIRLKEALAVQEQRSVTLNVQLQTAESNIQAPGNNMQADKIKQEIDTAIAEVEKILMLIDGKE